MLNKIIKNNIKSEKAITLIALVITIIVLLILAGISISMLTGDNSILQKATDAKEQTGIQQEKEIIALAYHSALTKKVTNGNSSAVTDSELNDELDSNEATAIGNPIIVTFIKSGNAYEIDSNGIIKQSTPKDPNDVNSNVLDSTGNIRITSFIISGTPVNNVPLPSSDFEKVDGTEIDSSYVARGKNGTDYAGDEFVWVPVDKNQQFTIRIEGSGNITSVILKNPIGDTATIASDISAPIELNEITPTINDEEYNGMYEIAVTTEEGEVLKEYIAVHSLYAYDVFNDYYATDEGITAFMNAKGIPSKAYLIAYLKSRNLISSDNPTNEEGGMAYGQLAGTGGYGNSDLFASKVAQNGGFWIGRYEASYNEITDKAASKPSTNIKSNSSSKEQGTLWNYVGGTEASNVAEQYNEELSSTIPSGAAWDRTIGWIYEKRNSTGKNMNEIMADSVNWGNYSNDTFSDSEGIINTGSKTQTMANNIYDLAGNLAEWTSESSLANNFRVNRGGAFEFTGNEHPVTKRQIYGEEINPNYERFGFRLVLHP